MFIGREKELRTLRDSMARSGCASMVYGKRKVGKTTLIQEAAKRSSKVCFYYECVKTSFRDNLAFMEEEMAHQGILPDGISFAGFPQLFAFLNTLPQELIFIIDEYPYLKAFDEPQTVDSIFQKIIDNSLKNIHLVLSGSHIGMMKELLEEGNPLFSRFTAVIRLQEMDYREASAFYPARSAYDKAAFFSVFGGSPFVNAQLAADASLKENILRLILDPGSIVRFYAENMLLSEFSSRMNFERILSAIGNGKKHYREIEAIANTERNGNLTRQLKLLTDMDVLKKEAPINRENDSKKATYTISDNLLRFYYTYLYRGRGTLQMVGPERYYEEYIRPTLTAYTSRRFEEICRMYFIRAAKSGALTGVRNIGSYYYDDPARKKNGEFDIAIEYSDGYGIWEAKYYKGKMEPDEIHRELAQIREIPLGRIIETGFLSVNGFAEQVPGARYLTGEDLYSP